jgi:hypothetical protein
MRHRAIAASMFLWGNDDLAGNNWFSASAAAKYTDNDVASKFMDDGGVAGALRWIDRPTTIALPAIARR